MSEERNSTPRKRKRRRKKKRSTLDRVLTILLILIASACAIVLGVLGGKGLATITKKDDSKQFAMIQDKVNNESEEIAAPKKEKKTFKNEFVNVLLVGMDEGDLSENAILNTREADSILLLNYYYNEKVVNVTSIPRDMSVEDNGDYFNLSEALKLGGIKSLVSSVEKKLECKVDKYVLVDIELFKEVVDIIGSINIKIPYDMEYDDDLQDLHIRFNKGETVSLDGELASHYIRWRMNNDGWTLPNNDISRIEHFQGFMKEMMIALKKPSSYMKLGMVAEAVGKNVQTDFSVVEIARYVLDFNEIEEKDITFNTVKGQFIKGVERDSFIMAPDKNQELIRLLKGNGIKNIDRNEMKIKVIYDSEYSKISDLKKKLKVLGYNNVVYETGEVEDTEMLYNEELSDNIDYLVYELSMEKCEILSQNHEKFDIILKVK
ncbi:LCP family protein [Oceanirhabdus sp. W0125-5]|uniref:LCP family protein n=1 Tax=Oceanirhabdus sp. W0125-5 TaxID=2999116 RepID=UPI0022F2DB31|nr:LCP family protein [Oceanirhabdus sp. W0125-5]WBW95838.1 LCP family protein [Oceanirhabdus sp. W0125-5]